MVCGQNEVSGTECECAIGRRERGKRCRRGDNNSTENADTVEVQIKNTGRR